MQSTQPQRSPPELGRPLRPRRVLSRVIPLLMLVLIAGLVAYQEVPQVRDFVLGQTRPEALRALILCREAALSQSASPGFARLLDHGSAHATPDGHYIDDLVVGEMQTGRGEVRVAVTCHVSASGELVQIHRRALTSGD